MLTDNFSPLAENSVSKGSRAISSPSSVWAREQQTPPLLSLESRLWGHPAHLLCWDTKADSSPVWLYMCLDASSMLGLASVSIHTGDNVPTRTLDEITACRAAGESRFLANWKHTLLSFKGGFLFLLRQWKQLWPPAELWLLPKSRERFPNRSKTCLSKGKGTQGTNRGGLEDAFSTPNLTPHFSHGARQLPVLGNGTGIQWCLPSDF